MRINEVSSYGILQSINNRPNFRRDFAIHSRWGANFNKQTGKTNFQLFSYPDAKAVFVEIADKTLGKMSNVKERIVQVLAAAGAVLTIKEILPQDRHSRIYRMQHDGAGVYKADGITAKPEDKYRYIIVTADNKVNLVKDPYAKKQENINGWSSIYDMNNYEWKNTAWLDGKDSRRIVRNKQANLRGLEKLIVDEINIPTLTKNGTFAAAISKIDEIASAGIATAIELLPVENTYSMQWGYDGVDKFAVNEKLGGAVKLKELIDYAHGKGLNVIIDMVPNHIGPDGDYLPQTGPYEKGAGQFGGEFNYEGKDNRYVRDYMVNAALWWANEFKVDGLRLDMTKMCGSDYLLKQIVSEVNEHNPMVFLIAEDARENKESVTRYEVGKPDHETELKLIDMSVDFITNNNWSTTPQNIGFDSEWDFRFMHTLKNAIIGGTNLDVLDDRIKNSNYRVKYVMSHDEIGNEDGTRLIPKIISRYLDLYNKTYGESEAEKGQKAAHLGQKLAEFIVSKDFEVFSDEELERFEKNIGLNCFISKKDLRDAFCTAFAKQKLAFATVMTVPGPKMFFQGDEEADLSYFKFFRTFSNPKAELPTEEIIRQKGYDTNEIVARPDCIVGRIKSDGIFKNVNNKMRHFNRKLVSILNSNPALLEGQIVGTYTDYNNNVHIHHLKCDDNEILVIKNFGQGFYDKNYGYDGFPQYGVWEEILSSDAKEFGGELKAGNRRKDITYNNQNLSVAANSVVILRKI